ncbi:MAG: hypothetical protein JWO45_1920, partial [Spartobacteria bacterium]|nr:hypothetical protein [Spartobacteria bacterium]
MTNLSILGSKIDFEFEGTFENSTTRSNVQVTKNMPLMHSSKRRGGPSEIGWHFRSTGGERGLYVAYASEFETPCSIILNGDVVQSFALFEPTGGTSPRQVDWRYQTTLTLLDGENSITLRREGDIPFISALGIGPAPRKNNAGVDDYANLTEQRRSKARLGGPFSVAPSSFSGLIAEIQKVSRDDGSLHTFREMASTLIDAVVDDAANGQVRIGFGGPLNGQRFRQQIFNRLLRLGADAIVETGAYLGTSTAFFARQGLPVYSCEAHPPYFASAVVQTASCANVSLCLQDSRGFLRELAAREVAVQFPFFYLDAHWNDDLPLADEITIITGRWERYAIMVDDFEVPGTGYTFDRYPNGLELTLPYLQRNGIDLTKMAVLFPSATPTAETGKRRGTLIL